MAAQVARRKGIVDGLAACEQRIAARDAETRQRRTADTARLVR
jgi:hypothetical protein